MNKGGQQAESENRVTRLLKPRHVFLLVLAGLGFNSLIGCYRTWWSYEATTSEHPMGEYEFHAGFDQLAWGEHYGGDTAFLVWITWKCMQQPCGTELRIKSVVCKPPHGDGYDSLDLLYAHRNESMTLNNDRFEYGPIPAPTTTHDTVEVLVEIEIIDKSYRQVIETKQLSIKGVADLFRKGFWREFIEGD